MTLYFHSFKRRWRRSIVAALASAPDPFWRCVLRAPAGRLCHRAYRLPPDALRQTDRQAASREVSLVLFSVYRLRRTAQSYHALSHPASAFGDRGTHAGGRFALAVFSASRLRISALILMETPPARVIRDCLSLQPRTGLADRAIIAAWPGVLLPATLMGF